MNNRQVIADHNDKEDEVVLKSLKKPVKNHVISSSTKVYDEDDLSDLNVEETSQRITGEREAKSLVKRTLIGNEGPDENGKIDFSRNQDCLDALIQYHESYKNFDTEEGYRDTSKKCYRQFNKIFSTKEKPCNVTEDEIFQALLKFYKPSTKQIKKPDNQKAPTPTTQKETVDYTQLSLKSLKIVEKENSVELFGDKFEICKLLACKSICVMQPASGSVEDNNKFVAGCSNSDGQKIISETCPQEAKLNPKEKMAFEMFKMQFNGDELKARKLLYMTKMLYK